MNSSVEAYKRRYNAYLEAIAIALKAHIQDCLTGISHIDRITARAKDPESFAKKASRINGDGSPKYRNPLTEVQDQLGARVIVFFRNDVGIVTDIVKRYFQPIEQKELVPESLWAFGYFGQHFVLPLPFDVVPQDVEKKEVPSFFELQIKTLFQHAWSEANHDIGYKASGPLSTDQQRRLAFTAAQSWGADRVFDELRSEFDNIDKPNP